jgi:alpha-1,2-mannosyltransferase
VIADAGTLREPPRRRLGWTWLVVTAGLVAVAGALLAGLFTAYGSDDPDKLGFDFRAAYYPAAELVAEGRSPYPVDPHDPQPGEMTLYHYPPQLAVVLAPLTRLPVEAVALGAVLVSFLALMAALALVGVRDVRCYAAVVIWQPSWNALEMANVSALLALGVALVWRFRDRLWPLAGALGVLVALKLFLWPLLAWAVATRRIAAAGLAVPIGLVSVFGSWALIGFAGLGSYPDLLSVISTQSSYSIEDMAQVLSFDAATGRAASLLVGGLLLALCVQLARRGDETRSFFMAIAAALAMSPIVWLHYLVLLAVPIGIARPRFSPIWLLPIVLWVCPRAGNGDGLETFLPAAVTAAVFVLLVLRPRRAPQAAVAT